jgi:hypothetical protein
VVPLLVIAHFFPGHVDTHIATADPTACRFAGPRFAVPAVYGDAAARQHIGRLDTVYLSGMKSLTIAPKPWRSKTQTTK